MAVALAGLLVLLGQVDGGTPALETVVTATRIPTDLLASPRAVTVVDAAELERRSPRTTPEALLEEEGVFLQRTNHAAGTPIVRGLLGQQVLLLVDGVRINNAVTRAGPNQYLNTVDPFLVEQVELVRGPASVLYGSDAVGGVVSVRTAEPRFAAKEGMRSLAMLKGLAGTADESLQGHLRLGMSLPDTAALGAFTARDFNDLSSALGPQRYTGYEEFDGALKVRQRLFPGGQVRLQYQAVRQGNAPRTDRSFPGDFRTFSLQERDLAHGHLELKPLGRLRELEVDVYAHRQFERVDRWVVARDRQEREDVEDWTLGLRTEAEIPLGEVLEAVGGVEFSYDRVTSRAQRRSIGELGPFAERPEAQRYPGVPQQLGAGAFALLAADADRPLSYHGGLRVQLSRVHLPEDARLATQFASAPEPPPVLPSSVESALGLAAEAGLQKRFASGLSFLANAGLAFRAPNVDDYLRLGSEGPGFTTPSRGLHPERSVTGELGSRLHRGPVTAQLFAAYSIIDGLVAQVPTEIAGQSTTPDGQPYLARVNAESAHVAALEAAVAVRPSASMMVSAHATHAFSEQRRRNLTSADEPFVVEPLPKSPPLSGVVKATVEPREGLFFEAALRWAAPQRRLAEADLRDVRICPETPTCRGTDGFAAVFVRAGAELSKHVRVAASLQNLTNALYRHHGSGVDEPGFSGVLSVEVSR